MSNSLFTLIRDAGRFALYSLVLGPALLLYGIVVNIAMEGSLSEQFVQEARNLTEGAPAGKVMQCVIQLAGTTAAGTQPGRGHQPATL